MNTTRPTDAQKDRSLAEDESLLESGPAPTKSIPGTSVRPSGQQLHLPTTLDGFSLDHSGPPAYGLGYIHSLENPEGYGMQFSHGDSLSQAEQMRPPSQTTPLELIIPPPPPLIDGMTDPQTQHQHYLQRLSMLQHQRRDVHVGQNAMQAHPHAQPRHISMDEDDLFEEEDEENDEDDAMDRQFDSGYSMHDDQTMDSTNMMQHSSRPQSSHEVHANNFITEAEFLQLAEDYLLSLSPKKREKALLTNNMYQKILMVLLQPKNTQVSTAQFRFWAKKMFTLSTTATHHVVCHGGKPVATKECLYDVLVYCHRKSSHGGRDKTSAEVRQHYSWVPKELIARFVKHCPLCSSRRQSLQRPVSTSSFLGPEVESGLGMASVYTGRPLTHLRSSSSISASSSQSQIQSQPPPYMQSQLQLRQIYQGLQPIDRDEQSRYTALLQQRQQAHRVGPHALDISLQSPQRGRAAETLTDRSQKELQGQGHGHAQGHFRSGSAGVDRAYGQSSFYAPYPSWDNNPRPMDTMDMKESSHSDHGAGSGPPGGMSPWDQEDHYAKSNPMSIEESGLPEEENTPSGLVGLPPLHSRRDLAFGYSMPRNLHHAQNPVIHRQYASTGPPLLISPTPTRHPNGHWIHERHPIHKQAMAGFTGYPGYTFGYSTPTSSSSTMVPSHSHPFAPAPSAHAHYYHRPGSTLSAPTMMEGPHGGLYGIPPQHDHQDEDDDLCHQEEDSEQGEHEDMGIDSGLDPSAD